MYCRSCNTGARKWDVLAAQLAGLKPSGTFRSSRRSKVQAAVVPQKQGVALRRPCGRRSTWYMVSSSGRLSESWCTGVSSWLMLIWLYGGIDSRFASTRALHCRCRYGCAIMLLLDWKLLPPEWFVLCSHLHRSQVPVVKEASCSSKDAQQQR